jgi:hypothetical protein
VRRVQVVVAVELEALHQTRKRTTSRLASVGRPYAIVRMVP